MPTKPIILPSEIDLDHFLSTQAHDLRTPFNHIIGFSKMTLNTVGDAPLTDFQKEDLGTIYRSGLRALTMLNGIIDIARIHRNEKDVHATPVSLDLLLEESLAVWKKFHPGSNFEIETRIPATTKNVLIDEQLTKQIISGFIAFVVQYCETPIKVTITVAEQPGWLSFTFLSQGTKSHQLSELDLVMTGFVNRSLVELQKGQIRSAEETDEGARIEFTLPIGAV
jgi:signal transduction histidine kinase